MNNKQRKEVKVAQDIFWSFIDANFWFLISVLVLYFGVYFLLLPFLDGYVEEAVPTFLTFSQDISIWYMLIYGGIGAYHYFPMHVQLGVTRKKTFIGTLLGVIAGAISLVILAVFISEGVELITGWFDLGIVWEDTLFNDFVGVSDGSFALDGSFLFEEGFLAAASRWGLTISTYTVILFMHYLLGWMAGTIFYRSDMVEGSGGYLLAMGGILLTLLYVPATDLLWGVSVFNFLPRLLLSANVGIQWLLAMLITLVLIALLVWIVRKLTKEIRIKLN